jgi:WD40 repeat protein
MQKSPFKFLDSYTKDDIDIFFGRDKEIEELYSRVFESKILLVYGISGTGKSSLLNCGLANKFNETDWLPISIRRGININQSLLDGLYRNAIIKTPFEKTDKAGVKKINIKQALQSIYLDHFKPIFLIFDQFEELFIFGNKEEKDELIENLKKIVDSEIQCKFIFSIREEYLAGVTEFEKVIPSFFDNRVRIEKMTRQNATQAIEGPCRVHHIEVETGFSDALLEKLNPNSPEVELTYLQVFLDKIFKLISADDSSTVKITKDILDKHGDVKDLLGSFLEEQISQLTEPETGLVILKSFVSVKGTKHQVTEENILEYSKTFGKNIDQDTVKSLIQKFIGLRILRDKDENGRYELRHDSLATKIYEKITLVEKELLEIRQFIENAFNNYEKREVLLNAEDIQYIAPYEDKLFLNDKTLKFLNLSKREIVKAKRRRQNILIAVASIIIIVLSSFSIWALRERSNAIIQQKVAEEQKNKAVKAKEEADLARQEAVISKKQAEKNEQIALLAKNQSEQARKEALAAKENALQQKNRAEELSIVANEQAQRAEKEKQISNQQREIAVNAEKKTKQLSLLSIAQNLALKSALFGKNPELMGLLAVQAFVFNKDNSGEPDDPIIYEALNKAYSTLDKSRHSVFTGSPNECKAMAESDNTILTIDLDGQARSWSFDGVNKKIGLLSYPSSINFVGFNIPGNRIITGHDNFSLCIWDVKTIDAKNVSYIELKGHKGMVRSANFSYDENYLASAGKDSLIIIWKNQSQTFTIVNTLKTPSAVKAVVFCGPDTLVSAQENGSIILWDIKKMESKILYSSNTEKPLCLAWNSKKGILLAGCSNGFILSFNIGQKNTPPPNKYEVHTTGIDQIAFNNDFSLLATTSWDKSIKFYNYHLFFELSNTVGGAIELKNLNCRARTLIFSKENQLIVGMSDKSIRVWETSSQKLAGMICTLVKRDMSKTEWDETIGEDIPYEKTCGKIP